MRSQPSTLLSIILHPSNEAHALYLLSEIPSCERFTVIDTTEDIRASPIAEPFILAHREKRLTLALSEALTCEAIQEIAQLVATGLLSGFIVQGEINLGEQIINNLHG
jgi:hypothetical protein